MSADKKTKEEDKPTPEKKEEKEVDPYLATYNEFARQLDKVEKSLEGDATALSSAERSLNRFRKRFDKLMWCKIIHFLIPKSTHEQIILLLQESDLYDDDGVYEFMVKESGLELEDIHELLAGELRTDGPPDVMQDVLKLVAKRLSRVAEDEERKAREKAEADGDVEMTEPPAAKATEEDEKEEKEKEKEEKEEKKRIRIRRWYLESSVYVRLLCLYEVYDCGKIDRCFELTRELIEELHVVNRRTLDVLTPRVYLLYTLCAKRLDVSVRKELFEWYERACLAHNSAGSLALTDAILGWYLDRNMYSVAHKFATKSELDEHASGNSALLARYHYYRGRIDVIQLQYSDALSHMQQALRRAPALGASGFKVGATKWLVVIQLLMGDIPEKHVFRVKNNRALLAPYFELTQTVREGVLTQFQELLANYRESFIQDRTYVALLRLRQNVIKTGLRRINRSYSALSLEDISNKLRLEGTEDAYYIVAKAIRDGVIEAVIDAGILRATRVPDVYSTAEPYTNFVDRTKFCLKVHTDAVTSFRYPQDDEETKRKDDAMSPEELAMAIGDMLDGGDDDDVEM